MVMGRWDRARTSGARVSICELLVAGGLLDTGAPPSAETPYIPCAGRVVTTHRFSGVRPRQEAVSWRLALVGA
jgi:hypothetical protein